PRHAGDRPTPPGAAMTVQAGAPVWPPARDDDASAPRRSELTAFHGRIMHALARLSGKTWRADAPRRRTRP
ncbi:MAG: hypothetical protein AAF772_10320, partial [Acidobacteriota bacterium]